MHESARLRHCTCSWRGRHRESAAVAHVCYAARLLHGCAVTPRQGARRSSTFETPAARGRSARRPRRSPCAACRPSAPPGNRLACRLGVGWLAAGWRLADHAPGGPDRRARSAGPAGGASRRGQQAGPAGGARRAGPCSDRPCALPETKISSTILGCTWLGLGLGV